MAIVIYLFVPCLLILYAIVKFSNSKTQWYIEGRQAAHRIFRTTGKIPSKVPKLSSEQFKPEYIIQYTKGFEKGIEDLYEYINDKVK